MTLIARLLESVDIKKCRKISPVTLKNLGYFFSERVMTVGTAPMTYLMYEMMDEDTKQPVSFCYLYSEFDRTGIILPKRFQDYIDDWGHENN